MLLTLQPRLRSCVSEMVSGCIFYSSMSSSLCSIMCLLVRREQMIIVSSPLSCKTTVVKWPDLVLIQGHLGIFVSLFSLTKILISSPCAPEIKFLLLSKCLLGYVSCIAIITNYWTCNPDLLLCAFYLLL